MNNRPRPNPYIERLVYQAYLDARKHKRMTIDVHRFEANAYLNLIQLAMDIENRSYQPGSSIAFIIDEPVTREIFAASFRDRIVHHIIYNLIADWWDRRFIYDNYSCRVGKGTLFGINRLVHHSSVVSSNYSRPAYILKLDLSGYFMSLPRRQLFDEVMRGLDAQYRRDSIEHKLTSYLVRQVIFDNPIHGVRLKGSLKDWHRLPKNKSLFYARKGCGIVIGNLTSQLFSNIYLNQLDRFVTIDLGFKHYGRYVDDFYIIDTEKQKLLELIPVLNDYLANLGLTLHPKKRTLRELNQGIDFLGATIYPYRIIPGKRIKKGFFRARYYDDARKIESYLGTMSHFKRQAWQQKNIVRAGG